jgi:hypothetical protein
MGITTCGYFECIIDRKMDEIVHASDMKKIAIDVKKKNDDKYFKKYFKEAVHRINQGIQEYASNGRFMFTYHYLKDDENIHIIASLFEDKGFKILWDYRLKYTITFTWE